MPLSTPLDIPQFIEGRDHEDRDIPRLGIGLETPTNLEAAHPIRRQQPYMLAKCLANHAVLSDLSHFGLAFRASNPRG